MRNPSGILGLGLLVALVAGASVSCRSSDKAGIILNVSTAVDVNRAAITALVVTVNGRTQSYDVGEVATWSLGIETSAGSKNISVTGMAASAVTAPWEGVVKAVAGQVVYRNVELQAFGSAPIDGGLPGIDGGAGDGPLGSGGVQGPDGSAGSGGGGRSGTGGGPGLGGTTGTGLPGTGGLPGSGGAVAGGAPGTGGNTRAGGAPGSGGIAGTGGTGTGGLPATGGVTASGGRTASGGATGTGGIVASGGTTASGGRTATGGSVATGGITSAGGVTGTGGATVCAAGPPLTGGTDHCTPSGQGTVGSYTWMTWSSGSASCMTTYADAACAFSATWKNSGELLARCGFQWDGTKTYTQLGTIAADFAETRTGTASSFSYIGVYGWSTNPCIEYYIIEDSFSTMPVNPGNTTNKGTVTIDGGDYILYTRNMTGTSRCSGAMSWVQFWSVRKTARQCGTISITQHFDAWAAAGMMLGRMYEASLLVETGDGTGSIDFTRGILTAQ